MSTSSKRAPSVSQVGIEAQALAARMVALQADAGLTIAMRMPILLQGSSRGQREAQRAVTEKVAAVMESGFAAGQAATQFWLGLMLNPLARVDLGEAAAKIANSSLEPFSKRTHATAARLSRRGSR